MPSLSPPTWPAPRPDRCVSCPAELGVRRGLRGRGRGAAGQRGRSPGRVGLGRDQAGAGCGVRCGPHAGGLRQGRTRLRRPRARRRDPGPRRPGRQPGPGEALVASIVKAKNAASGPQLFWRSVLCNLLGCLALWMAGRTRSDTAKLAVMVGAVRLHRLRLRALRGQHDDLRPGGVRGHRYLVQPGPQPPLAVPGNIVGGGMLVGLAYSWIGRPAQPVTAAPEPIPEPAVDAALAELVR
jgi:hypothetical protein